MQTKAFILTASLLLSGIAALCNRHTEEVNPETSCSGVINSPDTSSL